MENVTVSVQLLNAILGYLGTRPYQEVYQLIQAVQDAAKAQQELSGGSADAD